MNITVRIIHFIILRNNENVNFHNNFHIFEKLEDFGFVSNMQIADLIK